MVKDSVICYEYQAPWAAADSATAHIGQIAYAQGVEPQPRTLLPGYDSGIMTLLLVTLLLITLNFRHYSTFIKTFTNNLFSVRKRQNAFDQHSTVSEARILISLGLMLSICLGILIFDIAAIRVDVPNPFAAIAALSAMAAGYYLFQLAAYNAVGYIFTTPTRRSLWLKGFNASQALLSLTLVIPAVVSLFNPQLSPLLLSISTLLYFSARLIFIIKGFRIFYINYFSLIYFILYLCSLEIIPLLALYKASIFIITIV